ncbi:MAG: peptidoglycan-binding domain-containing protein [Gemmatimonadota bacterium]
MRSNPPSFITRGVSAFALSLFVVSALSAQARLALPEGSVIIVRTTSPLQSATMKANQTFETVVADTITIDNYTVIPAGSRIRGVVTFVQPADRQRSGVIEVNFDRLTLAGGTSFTIDGKLTSTNAEERRQIDSDPGTRVVLVGGRGGIGAAIAGAGAENSPVSAILVALGSKLSEARNVSVPSGTALAVQLEQRLVLSGRGRIRSPDGSTIYTAADRIRAAQQALAAQNYYRGAVNGQLNEATQRALFEFQIDKGITATGNLDGRTAQALGISAAANAGTGGSTAAVMSAANASQLRRNAQSLAGRYRQDLAISTTGSMDARRRYSEAEVELWFALSAFADNASLYEQLVRVAGNAEGSVTAGRALIAAARRVDAAFQRARPTAAVQNGWSSLRTPLVQLDAAYR